MGPLASPSAAEPAPTEGPAWLGGAAVSSGDILWVHTLGGGSMAVAWAWATVPRRGGAAGGFDIYNLSEVRDPLSTT